MEAHSDETTFDPFTAGDETPPLPSGGGGGEGETGERPEGEAGGEVPVGERYPAAENDEASSEQRAGASAPPPAAMPFPIAEQATADMDIGRELSLLLSQQPDELEASRDEQGEVQSEPVLCFLLADVWFGAPTSLVRQVVAMPTIYPVPTTPAYLLGVANLNGQVTPVIDLRRFLEIEPAAPQASPFEAISKGGEEIGTRRMVVVHAEGLSTAFPVDLVREVLDIPTGLFQEARVSEGRVREYARGELRFRKGVLTLLELPALLQAARIQTPGSAQAAGEAR